jgi:DNA (cytosine-5)-methyltransferase 1
VNELALFAGAGGGILGGHLLGWRTVCAVEWDAYAAGVLVQRQNDGVLAPFPIWDDVRTFDGKPWRGIVGIISGGFPCQDISVAGKGGGIRHGERSGLWKEMVRIVGDVRPRYAFIENTPALAFRGLDDVIADIAALGYDAEWTCLGAQDVGAPHRRKRIWILAYADGVGQLQPKGGKCQLGRRPGDRRSSVADANRSQREGNERTIGIIKTHTYASRTGWWQAEPDVGRVADGVAHRLDRLTAIGNGQVPAVASTAFLTLYKRIHGLEQ